MPTLNLKPTHKAITAYYDALDRYKQVGISHETASSEPHEMAMPIAEDAEEMPPVVKGGGARIGCGQIVSV